MRVAILTTSFPLTRDSISGIFVSRLVRHLPNTVKPTVLTPCGQFLPETQDKTNYQIKCFRYAPLRWQILAHQPGGIPVALKHKPILLPLVPLLLLSSLLACFRACRRVDVIHANWSVNGVIAATVAHLLRVPVITTLRGEDVTRAKKLRLDRLLLRLCVVLSSRIVTVSSSIGDFIKSGFPHYAHKVCVIPNGIDASLLQHPIDRKREHKTLQLISIGSLIPRKGLDQALLALACLSDDVEITLDILGNGPEEGRLKEIAKTHGLESRVRFLGQIHGDEIPQHLQAADAMLLCSYSEGRPNVVLEAMATGLPVIATDIEGVRELVRHGITGLMFTPGDIDELARHILSLRDSMLRSHMGKAARQFIVKEGLLWEDTAVAYAKLYEEVRQQRVFRLSV